MAIRIYKSCTVTYRTFVIIYKQIYKATKHIVYIYIYIYIYIYKAFETSVMIRNKARTWTTTGSCRP